MAAIEKICPDARGLLLCPRTTRATCSTCRTSRRLRAHPAPGRPGRAHRQPAAARSRSADRRRAAERRDAARSSRCVRRGNRARARRLRPLRRAAQQRPVGRAFPAILRRHRAAVLPPLQAGWSTAPQVATTSPPTTTWPRTSPELVGIDPWLINPYFGQCGAGQLPRADGRGMPRRQRRRRARATSARSTREYGITDDAVRHRQGRRRHLRHGHHDGEGRRRSARPQPQAAQQDGGRQGRPGGQRGDHPGGRATPSRRRRRGRRAGGLHDRPLRGRRLLPRAHRARHGREPERARHAVRAARLRRAAALCRTAAATRMAAPTASTPTAWSRAWRCSPPRSSSSRRPRASEQPTAPLAAAIAG